MADRARTDRLSAEKRGHRGESLAAPGGCGSRAIAFWAGGIKTHAGEIDLVSTAALRPGLLYRGQGTDARPATRPKRSAPAQRTRIARAASLYLASRPALARRGARFDIVAVGAGFPGICRMSGGRMIEEMTWR